MVYEYDELNRLIKASATGGGGWSQSFVHDGFGNLREQKVNSGVAPAVMLNVNMSNNRLSDSGWTYDGNGNTLSMPVVGGGTAGMAYDVDNRLATWTKTGTGAVESYGYLADNKRVWKKMPNGTEYYYFYGVGGHKLLTYTVSSLSPFTLGGGAAANVYFGGKLIRADGIAVVHDRLGSVVARGNCGVGCSGATAKDYFPYGEEIGAATAGNQDKFGTYHRDATSGLDYADQRYFAGTLAGRFLTADVSGLNESLAVSTSWNQYSYVVGDPVNLNDPEGLACSDVALRGWAGIADRTPVETFLSSRSDIAVLSLTIFTESEAGVADDDSANDRAAIAASIMNRWALVNGNWDVIAQNRFGGGPIRLSDWGTADRSVASIVFSKNQYEPWDSAWRLNPSAQARLTSALNSREGSDECAALLQSIGTAAGYWAARSTTTLYYSEVNGRGLYLTSFSAAARGNQPTKAYYEEWIGSFGSGNVFAGLHGSQIVPRGSVQPWRSPEYPPSRSESGVRRPSPPVSSRGRQQ